MKSSLRLLFISSALILVILGIAYGCFPYWARLALQHHLPQGWHLAELIPERPGLDQWVIHRVGLVDASGNTFSADEIRFTFSAFEFRLTSATIERVAGDVSLSWVLAQSPAAPDKPAQTQLAISPDGFSVPQVSIRSIAVDFVADDETKIQLTGGLSIDAKQGSGKLNLTTAWGDRLQFQLQQRPQQFSISADIDTLSLAQWLEMFRPWMEPILSQAQVDLTAIEGQVSGSINTAWEAAVSAKDDVFAQFHIANRHYALSQAESGLQLHGITLSHRDASIVDLSAEVTTRLQQGLWQTRCNKLNAQLQLNHSLSWLNKSRLSLYTDDLKFRFSQPKLEIDGALEVEQQRLQIHSQLPWDVQQPSLHHLTLDLKQLDEQWSPWLNSWHIAGIAADLSFELQKQGEQWLVSNAKAKRWRFDNIQRKDPWQLHLKQLEMQPVFKSQFRLDSPQWTDANLSLEGLYIASTQWKLWTQLDLEAELHNRTESLSLNYRLTPSVEELFSQQLLLSGTELRPNLDGRGVFNLTDGKLELLVNTSIDLYSPKPFLMRLVPKQKSLIKELEIASPIHLTGRLTGRKMQQQAAELKGSLSIDISGLSLADTSIDNASFAFNWADMQPWYRVNFLSSVDLNYRNRDQQHHQLELEALLYPKIQFRRFILASKLLGGEAQLIANEDYRSWNDSSGELVLKQIKLEHLSQLLESSDLSFSGELSGRLPLYIAQNQLHFGQGELRSERGQINYIPGGVKKKLTKETAPDIATIALQNFHYQSLIAKLNRGGPCGFDFDIRVEGHNPDIGDQAKQIFNIKYQPASNVNMYYLITLGEDFIQQLDQQGIHSGCVH